VFHLLLRYYKRVKDVVEDLEDCWIFLMERVYLQQQKGKLIFESLNKQLFKELVLDELVFQELAS